MKRRLVFATASRIACCTKPAGACREEPSLSSLMYGTLFVMWILCALKFWILYRLVACIAAAFSATAAPTLSFEPIGRFEGCPILGIQFDLAHPVSMGVRTVRFACVCRVTSIIARSAVLSRSLTMIRACASGI